jgi:hypothetical protein
MVAFVVPCYYMAAAAEGGGGQEERVEYQLLGAIGGANQKEHGI